MVEDGLPGAIEVGPLGMVGAEELQRHYKCLLLHGHEILALLFSFSFARIVSCHCTSLALFSLEVSVPFLDFCGMFSLSSLEGF